MNLVGGLHVLGRVVSRVLAEGFIKLPLIDILKLTIYDRSINYNSCQVWIGHGLVQNKSSNTKRKTAKRNQHTKFFWKADLKLQALAF